MGVSATGVTGGALTIDSTVATSEGASTFYVRLYLSADATITGSDVQVGEYYVGGLAPGASVSRSTTVTVPNTLAEGSYYVGAIVDAYNHVKESDETNNAAAGNQVAVTKM